MERLQAMVNSIIPAVSAVGAMLTYWTMGFLADASVIPDLTIFDKIGGGLTVGAILFFILRWALKRNDTLTEQIRTMQDERTKMAEVHFKEIKEILKSKT